MKVRWRFCTTAPNLNVERSSAEKTLAHSLCCSDLYWKGATFYCFAHLNCCWLEVFLCGWGTKECLMFLIFLFWFLSINLHLLWTQSLCQYEESSRTFLGRGKYSPWRNCWGTMDSMDWLLLSKRMNGVSVFLLVCHKTESKLVLNSIDDPLPTHSHRPVYTQGLVFSWRLGLAQSICLLRKEH